MGSQVLIAIHRPLPEYAEVRVLCVAPRAVLQFWRENVILHTRPGHHCRSSAGRDLWSACGAWCPACRSGASSTSSTRSVARLTQKQDTYFVRIRPHLAARVASNESDHCPRRPGSLAGTTFRDLARLRPGRLRRTQDATAQFDMIHPRDVVEKYAPDAVIGVVGSGKAKKVKGAGKSALVATDKGDAVANVEAWRDWRMEDFDDTPRVLSVNVRSHVNVCYY